MSTSSNVSHSTYSPSEPETPQSNTQNRIQSFDQSLNHADLGHSIENSLKNAQKEMHQKRIQALRKELDYIKSTEWEFEYDKGFVQEDDENDEDEDVFDANLAEMQVKDAINNSDHYGECTNDIPETTNNKNCFRKTGVVSYIDTVNDYALIDGTYYFDTSWCSQKINLNDKVSYLGYYKEDNEVVIVRILENEGNFWGEVLEEEVQFEQTDHTLIGQVDRKDGRHIYMANGDIKFNLDLVAGTFLPIEGDLLELNCKVILGDDGQDKPAVISSAEVVEVIAFRPLGLKITTGMVLEWNGVYGKCDKNIYFDKQCLPAGVEPKIGSKVIMKIIESFQEKCIHRAIQLQVFANKNEKTPVVDDTDEESTLQLEMDHKLDVTHPLSFDVEFNHTAQLYLKVTNKSDQQHVIKKWIVLSKKKNSQITIRPLVNEPLRLLPGQAITFNIVCQPKFLGRTKENLIIMFRGFKVKRNIHINVVSKEIETTDSPYNMALKKTDVEIYAQLKEIRCNRYNIVHGRKFMKNPNFVATRIGQYHIPDKIWSLFLGDSTQLVESEMKYTKIYDKIDDQFPFLIQELSTYNYSDKWHTLLFLEEIQSMINIRSYDISKAYLIRCQEYLSLEVSGLSERRPSLIMGDRALVKDIWNDKASKYEGIIHDIRENCILMKFSQTFHETYSGTDVSVEFCLNRSVFRRSHHAINMAITNLGPPVLFPMKLIKREPQIPPENLNSTEWFNTNLNSCQKDAVSNILLGECRPMPYCIYGPPGTGKTVTVVETILQILTHIPHSRILVATPSNSAANLITERMLDFKENNHYSLIRIIANHMYKKENIPEKIKAYCVTVDVSAEGTSLSKQVNRDGMKLNCQSSFIGRHRVTISTCKMMGALVYMGFPKGHFTHVIVDEAGQATEPETMIPLSLTDKETGQIILAGDPMQLGPTIISYYCQQYGMEESYLSRILDTFPYQKDFSAFEGGFNKKLITKLNENYRSVKEILTLPSQMFYDGSLLERIDRNQPWIERLINVTSEIFETGDSKSGGIYVYGIRGCNTKARDSPSWYNPQEATMVALTTSKILKRNVTVDEIGIITPYVAQIKYLRSLFDGIGLPQPKIGTVEDFQGQEKPIIIISTVRSTLALVQEDIKNTLGFVQNYKRLNVAITRGQVAVILFCDPHLLCSDPLWSNVVSQAVKEDKYMGCHLPKQKKQEKSK